MANPDKFVEIGGSRFRVEEDGAWISMDLNHERLHLGHVFHAGTLATTVANGGTLLLTAKAGTIQPHILWNVAAGGAAAFRIVENGAIAGSATASIYNRNRSATGTPLMTVLTGGTLTGGTAIETLYIPGGTGGGRQGSGGRADTEWLGAASRTYTFEVVNNSGGNAGVSISVDWYEVNES